MTASVCKTGRRTCALAPETTRDQLGWRTHNGRESTQPVVSLELRVVLEELGEVLDPWVVTTCPNARSQSQLRLGIASEQIDAPKRTTPSLDVLGLMEYIEPPGIKTPYVF